LTLPIHVRTAAAEGARCARSSERIDAFARTCITCTGLVTGAVCWTVDISRASTVAVGTVVKEVALVAVVASVTIGRSLKTALARVTVAAADLALLRRGTLNTDTGATQKLTHTTRFARRRKTGVRFRETHTESHSKTGSKNNESSNNCSN